MTLRELGDTALDADLTPLMNEIMAAARTLAVVMIVFAVLLVLVFLWRMARQERKERRRGK